MYFTESFQNFYLSNLITHQKPVTLRFKTGRKLNGTLVGMTKDALFFRCGMTEMYDKKMIYDIFPQDQYINR